ncbi:ComE operon protein 3 [bacterium HR23]|nr:ComE operon protein 3 [bacterium HR23]
MQTGAWALAWGAVGWTAGLILGRTATVPRASGLLVVLAGIALGLLLTLVRRPLVPALVLGAAGLGLLRMSFHASPLHTPLPAPVVPVDMVVRAGPAEQVGGLWRLTGRVEASTGEVPGWGQQVLVYLQAPPEGVKEGRWPPVQRGDRLYLSGRLERLPEGEVGRALTRQGIVGVLRLPKAYLVEAGGKGLLGAVERFRWRLALTLRRALPQPEAGLGQALLLGLRGDMLPEELEAFRQAGTAHLLAVSGLHVALVLGILDALTAVALGRRPWAVVVPLVGIWGYGLLTGLGAPVVRAGIMGSMALASRALGRPWAPLSALSITVGVMAGLSPDLLGQVAFQLSVAGMAGLVALGPRLNALLRRLTGRWEKGRPWLSALVGSTAYSLGASLGAVPLSALTFERLPLLGVVGTLVSLPLLTPALVLTGATALLGTVWEPAGWAGGWIAWVSLACLRLPSAWLGGMEWAAPRLQGIGPWVWGFYGFLALAWGWPFLRETLPQWIGGRPLAFQWAFPLLAGATALAWASALQVPPPRLTLEAFPNGSWVLVGPKGQTVVATVGSDPRPVLKAVGRALPFWERRVALLLVPTSYGLTAGQEVLRRYRVEKVVAVSSAESIPRFVPLQKGVWAELGGGLWLAVEEETPRPSFRILWGRVVWAVQGASWAQRDEGVSLALAWERGAQSMVPVARAGDQEWVAPPGGALQVTADQERMWVRVQAGVP